MVRKLLGLGCVVGVLLAAPAPAMEKAAVRASDLDGSEWTTAETFTISYYNGCTGWYWLWGGWDFREQVGVVFEVPSGGAVLETTTHYVVDAAPGGYGYSGFIEVYASDSNDCPTGPPLAQLSWLPTGGWQGHWETVTWGGVSVPQRFIVAVSFGTFFGGVYERLVSDHPAAGPTGPAACGLCYPTARQVRSFYYGTTISPLCPGETIHDEACDVEFLWVALLSGVTSLEPTSWAGIKTLYR